MGKSTVAVNLAYTLTQMGAKVGLFDADVYGPSLPTMITPEKRVLEVATKKCAFNIETIVQTHFLSSSQAKDYLV